MGTLSLCYSMELVTGGRIRKWAKLQKAGSASVGSAGDVALYSVEWSSTVDWNRLIQGLQSIGAAHWQAWIVGTFEVDESGDYTMHCPGLHSFLVTDGREQRKNGPPRTTLLAGDVYRSGQIFAAVGGLEKGRRYYLLARITAKFQTAVGCRYDRSFHRRTSLVF